MLEPESFHKRHEWGMGKDRLMASDEAVIYAACIQAAANKVMVPEEAADLYSRVLDHLRHQSTKRETSLRPLSVVFAGMEPDI